MITQSVHKPATDRRILRRLRDVVARKHTPQFKLDRIVRLLSAGLQVDVCSVYVLDEKNYLELSATWGLSDAAVHKTRLHISEGLVGEAARMRLPVCTDDVKAHPSFVYKKETQEDDLNTFLGVPIVRQEKTYGVLVLQTKEKRLYEDREIELLEVASLVVGDILAQGYLSLPRRADSAPETHQNVYNGRAFSKGRPVYGRVLLYGRDLPAYKPLSNKPVETEKEALREALAVLKESLQQVDQSWAQATRRGKEGANGIFESYSMLVNDPSWHDRIEGYIDRGFTAAASVTYVQQDMEHQFAQVSDESAAWVLEDLRDLTNKLVFIIQNENQLVKDQLLKQEIIVVAKSLGPGDLLTLKGTCIKGIVLENGGPNSHVVLLSKSMGIPLLGWVEGVVNALQPTDHVLLDSTGQALLVNPSASARKAIEERYKTSYAGSSEGRQSPTKKNQEACHEKGIEVQLNVGLTEEIESVTDMPVDGVGLLRTEILFMEQQEFPNIEAQMLYYKKLIENVQGGRCCVRTLDIGSDKNLPYFRLPEESNPALGWRSIRISLDRLTIFRHQLRALILAAQFGPIDILFPFVATAEEYFKCRDIFNEEKRSLRMPRMHPIRLGLMIETTSIYCDLDRLQGAVDFLAVGTNDLFQLFFACDRTNPNIAYRYDPLSFSFLLLLKKVQDKAKKLGFDLSVCGDMGSMRREVKVLAALGYRKFSCMLPMAGAIQKELAEMDLPFWKAQVEAYLKAPPAPSFRYFLEETE